MRPTKVNTKCDQEKKKKKDRTVIKKLNSKQVTDINETVNQKNVIGNESRSGEIILGE